MESILLFIKSLITEPTILILIVLTILLKTIYPKFRGFMGEFWVKIELNKLNKKEYIILNDIMLEDENGTHQIDHIVISKYGIFVIEMKNYYGMITGNEYNNTWTQYLGKNKYYFKNPIHQNYGHIKALEKILNLNNNLFISIICFSNQAKIRIDVKSIVTQLDYLNNTIKKFNKILIDNNINELANKIISLNITEKSKRKSHINNIKTKLNEEHKKTNNMICPKCNGDLILKSGKYGSFIGCTNYPKCKYIKK